MNSSDTFNSYIVLTDPYNKKLFNLIGYEDLSSQHNHGIMNTINLMGKKNVWKNIKEIIPFCLEERAQAPNTKIYNEVLPLGYSYTKVRLDFRDWMLQFRDSFHLFHWITHTWIDWFLILSLLKEKGKKKFIPLGSATLSFHFKWYFRWLYQKHW